MLLVVIESGEECTNSLRRNADAFIPHLANQEALAGPSLLQGESDSDLGAEVTVENRLLQHLPIRDVALLV